MHFRVRENSPDGHYHDTNKHGMAWVLLNKALHLIVLVYALFGMIRFKIKFIHAVKLVKFISAFMIVHSWYLSIKFGLIAACMYYFNFLLESKNYKLQDFNCSLSNGIRDGQLLNGFKHNSLGRQNMNESFPPDGMKEYVQLVLAGFVEAFGGPFMLLGNRATLMFGFYSSSLFIMLAIFPIELVYMDIGFNYIRFVLNDVTCLQELYMNKNRHLNRLNAWSRTKNSSIQTMSIKKTTSQKDLRCHNLYPARELVCYNGNDFVYRSTCPPHERRRKVPKPINSTTYAESNAQIESATKSIWNVSIMSRSSYSKKELIDVNESKRMTRLHEDAFRSMINRVSDPIRSLRHSLSNNHLDEPSSEVKIANRNLQTFKPHARSESWFKSSMVVYPIFVFYYFGLLTFVIGSISVYFLGSIESIKQQCEQKYDEPLTDSIDWGTLGSLMYYETQYSVFALSCASSFYCSYYFGTIVELFVWVHEISQQLTLCKIVIELKMNDSIMRILSPYESSFAVESLPIPHGGPEGFYNQFGGIENFCNYMRFRLFRSQSEQYKSLELMALRLLSKKQTLLRATYININLLFDELNDTRFMTQTILGRTSQIAFGFAAMVSITKSQFESNTIHLTILLAAALAILNLYLICAAMINSSVSR